MFLQSLLDNEGIWKVRVSAPKALRPGVRTRSLPLPVLMFELLLFVFLFPLLASERLDGFKLLPRQS
jgi:hypothetical protein